MMKFLIIVATVVICSYAAPAVELLHPSPVNPDVLVALKPEEKLVLITDPEELIKFKRETKQPFYPTVLPEEQKFRIINSSHQKRDVSNNTLAQGHHPADSLKKANENDIHDGVTTTPKNQTAKDQKFPTQPLISKEIILNSQQHKRDIPVPLVPKHHHPEESLNDNNENNSFENKKEVYTEPEAPSPGHETKNTTVTLIPKEESPKYETRQVNNKEVKPENHLPKKSQDLLEESQKLLNQTRSPTDHPLIRNRPVPVAELFSRPRDN